MNHGRVELLSPDTIVAFLQHHGLLANLPVEVGLLDGGVSSVVMTVDGHANDAVISMVVKQSLAELKVATRWLAPQDRVLTEADGLRLAATLTPGRAPRLLGVQPDAFVICLQRAPATWTDWKTRILRGKVDPQIAAVLGEVLGTWHARTDRGANLSERIRSTTAFGALRIDPYFRTLIKSAPELATPIGTVIEDLQTIKTCFVHGDFSPKNILVGSGPNDVWVIDFEVGTYGDPAFDVAFLVTHLLLKSVHRPELSDALDKAQTAFISAYTSAMAVVGVAPSPLPRTLRYVGALLLARVKGKSPAAYLTADQAGHVWRLGLALMADESPTLESLRTYRRSTTS